MSYTNLLKNCHTALRKETQKSNLAYLIRQCLASLCLYLSVCLPLLLRLSKVTALHNHFSLLRVVLKLQLLTWNTQYCIRIYIWYLFVLDVKIFKNNLWRLKTALILWTPHPSPCKHPLLSVYIQICMQCTKLDTRLWLDYPFFFAGDNIISRFETKKNN